MSMYADEKSDEGIGPMKQPNKEGSPSAEAAEGRTSPEGNGGQTAAARTLRRDTASIGLAGVRRAARQSKSVRFTALLHHITVDLLEQSYCALERDSAPGIDGVPRAQRAPAQAGSFFGPQRRPRNVCSRAAAGG